MQNSHKIALVTGGSRGLGKNSAIALAKTGVDIILTYVNNQSAALEVVKEIQWLGRKAIALPLDLADSSTFAHFAQSVEKALNHHFDSQHFDYLVNNAGMGIHASFADTTEEQFDSLMKVHLKGTFFITQNLLPFINNGGKILNFSSGLARFSFPGYAAYAVMKGGIEVMTRYMAKELGHRGISVNTIAPGAIETDFGGGAVRDNTELNRMLATQTALGRVGLPDVIGGVVASLMSESNNWINGQRIEASGGMLL
jgi:NAD(P)-dependent dehydrogenase (short-subunit alcohol dehydrogenase family)